MSQSVFIDGSFIPHAISSNSVFVHNQFYHVKKKSSWEKALDYLLVFLYVIDLTAVEIYYVT